MSRKVLCLSHHHQNALVLLALSCCMTRSDRNEHGTVDLRVLKSVIPLLVSRDTRHVICSMKVGMSLFVSRIWKCIKAGRAVEHSIPALQSGLYHTLSRYGNGMHVHIRTLA